jgi:hypothetical protein
MGVVMVAPNSGVEKVVMGNEERTEYRVRNRVVEVHQAHVPALKMMGFYEPKPDKPVEVTVLEPVLSAEQAAALLKVASAPAQEAPARSK